MAYRVEKFVTPAAAKVLSKNYARTEEAIKTLDLIEEYQKTKNEKLRKKIIERNLNIVKRISRYMYNKYKAKFKLSNDDIHDLYQEGILGIITALEKFDLEKGVTFSTYSSYWIISYIFRYLFVKSNNIRFITTKEQQKVFFNYGRVCAQLGDINTKPSDEEVAKFLKIRIEHVKQAREAIYAYNNSISIDEQLFDDGKTFHDTITIETEMDQEEQAFINERQRIAKKVINDIFNTLTEREQDIITYRFFAEKPKSFQEIADKHNVKRQRIQQIEIQLFNKIKNYMLQNNISAEDIL